MDHLQKSLVEQRQHAADVSLSSSFTHQTVYKHHIACCILWMQDCSVTAHCATDAGLKKPFDCNANLKCLLAQAPLRLTLKALLQYAFSCLTAYHVFDRYIFTDSHHHLWQQPSKLYNMPVTLDCEVQSEMKCAQLAQQDAELAAAKQESATCLAAHQDFQRVRPATYVHSMACKSLSLFKQAIETFTRLVLHMCNTFS